MPKTQFPYLLREFAELTPRQREGRAAVFANSAQPLLQALALELLHTNAVETAELAQLDAELSAEQSERIEAEARAAGIPDPPTAA